jgi:5-methylcytosine-specific restriction endonuclease McrA
MRLNKSNDDKLIITKDVENKIKEREKEKRKFYKLTTNEEKKKDISQKQIENNFTGNYPFSSTITEETIHNKKEYNRSLHWVITKRHYKGALRKRQVKSGTYKSRIMCEKCGITVETSVHHLDYSNIGSETSSDLIVLCYKCHSKAHGLEIETAKKHKKMRKEYFSDKKTMKLEDVFNFGKFRGKTLENVITFNRKYIEWAIKNKVIEIDEQAQNLINSNSVVSYTKRINKT